MKKPSPLTLPSTGVIETLFDSLPVGVIALDQEGRVVVFNRHEERLAGRKRERVLGKRFFDEVAPCMNVRQLAGAFFDQVHAGTLDTKIEFSFPFPNVSQPRDVFVRMASFIADGAPHALLMVEDVSMQRSVERLKDMLSTLLVHDMKSPLTGVLANLEFVRSELHRDLGPSVALDAVADGIDGALRLSRMIHDLLDITRLETGTFPLDRKTDDVGAVVAEAVLGAGAAARARNIVVQTDLKRPLDAPIDGAAVRRVLDNLIDNAVRHTKPGSRVVVAGWSDGGDVVIDVVDQGPGIPAELRERIFEKFAQVDGGRTRSGNHGLGLTFVRMAVRAHGGDVTLVDTPGVGTTFRVRLPKAVVTEPSG